MITERLDKFIHVKTHLYLELDIGYAIKEKL